MKSLWSALLALGFQTRDRIKTLNRKARRQLRALQMRHARRAGAAAPSLASQGVFGIEPLEARQVLAATLITPTADVNVAVSAPSQVIDLTGRFGDDGAPGSVVRVVTTYGDFYIGLTDNATPLTVANFLKYVNADRYDNTIFHRLVDDFVLQGGGYNRVDEAHITQDPAVPNEFGASNLRGTVAMAKLGSDPNSATSEWFVNLNDNSANLDQQNGGFTVFGRVLGNGMRVVDELVDTQTFNQGSSFTEIPLRNYYKDFPVFLRNYLRVYDVKTVPVMPTATNKDSLLTMSVKSSNPSLVKAKLDGSNLNLSYASGREGRSIITIRSYDTADGSIVEDSFVVTVGNPSGTLISVSASDATRAEGSSGNAMIEFTLTLSAPATQRVTVNFQTSDRSAIGREYQGDYVPTRGTVTFNPGDTTATVRVPVRGDTRVETTENFALILTRPTGNLYVEDGAGTGTISNDDAPTFTSVSDLTGSGQDKPFTITYQTLLNASDASKTNGSPLFRIQGISSGTLTKDGQDVVSSVTTIGPGETIVWTPGIGAHGTLNAFTLRAVAEGLVSDENVLVKVKINDAPTLTTISPIPGGTEDQEFTVTYAMLLAASNAADVNGDAIKFRVDSVTSGTTLTKDGKPVVNNSTLIGPGESVVWKPGTNANGDLNAFRVRLSDGQTTSSSSVQVTVNLAAVNDLPTISTVTEFSGAVAGTPFTITYDTLLASADEADPDASTTFSFRIEQISSGTLTKNGVAVTAGSTIVSLGDTLAWTPAVGTRGRLNAFRIVASDGTAFSTRYAQVVVNAVAADNHVPTISSVSPLTGASEDTNFTITYTDLTRVANEKDQDGDTVIFRFNEITSGTLLKNGVAVVPGVTTLGPGESVVWKSATDANGLLTAFTILASDGVLTSETPVAVRVQTAAVNDRPTLGSVEALTGAVEDQPYTITYAALAAAADETDVDSPGQLSFRVSAVSSGSLTKNGATISPGSTLLGPGESLVWTPANNANGSIQAFTIVAFDGSLASTTAVPVNIVVAAANDAPTLSTIAPLIGASANTAYTVKFSDLLAAANEADTDATTTFIFRIESVTTGTLTKNGTPVAPGVTTFSASDADGSLVWTPATGAAGSLNAFKVVVGDGTSFSTGAVQVKIQTVRADNHAPTLTNVNTLSLATEDQAFTITYASLAAAANEADPDSDTVFFKVIDVTSGTLTKNGVAVTEGTTILRSDESLVWTPASNANGTLDAFTIVATDGVLDSTTPVQIKVQTGAVNDAPTLTTISLLSGATEDTPFTLTYEMLAAAANEADVDSTAILFRISTLSSGTVTKNGVPIVVNTTTLGPGESVVWTPALNANGDVSAFFVQAYDGAAASASSQLIRITTTAVNDAPTLTTVNNLFGAVAGVEFPITFATLQSSANEADVDSGTTFTFRIESITNGTLTRNGQPVQPGAIFASSETLVWTPSSTASGLVPAFTIVSSDGTLFSSTPVAVNIQTTGTNNTIPTLTSISPFTGGTEDTPFTITYAQLAANANEADADGDILLFRIESLPTGAGSTLTINGTAATVGAIVHPGETLSWLPQTDVSGLLTAFTVAAFDGVGASTPAVGVQVNVAAANDRPTLTTINTLTGAIEDQSYTISYTMLAGAADEADVDPNSPALTFRINAISTGTLTKNGIAVTAGTTTLGPNETLVWTPAANANGTLNAFTVSAYDGVLTSITPVQVRVEVEAKPDAPTLTTIDTLFGAIADQPYTITYESLAAAGNENDPDGSSTVLVFRVSAIASGTLTKNGDPVVAGTTTLAAGESFIWTPAASASGLTNAFTLVVSDGDLSSSPAVSVKVQTVGANNQAPTLTTINKLTGASEDTAFGVTYESLLAAANEADADGNALLFRIVDVVSGTLSKNGVPITENVTTLGPGETVFWTPAANANGTLDAFTVVVTDGVASSATPVLLRVETTPVNDAPTLSTINTLSGAIQNAPFTITYDMLAAAANEADTDTFGQLSFRIQGVDAGTLTKNGTAIVSGTTLLSSGESLVWTPPSGQTGEINAFSVVAFDGSLASSGNTAVRISIAALPTLTSVSTFTGAVAGQPQTITFDELLNAANEGNTGSNPSFRIQTIANGTLTKNGEAVVPGTTIFSTGDTLVWTPAESARGNVAAFSIVASNGTLFSASAVNVNFITVAPDNTAPTLTSVNTLTGAVATQTLTITYATLLASSNAADADTNNVLLFKFKSVQSGTLTKNGQAVVSGTTLAAGESILWTPASGQIGDVPAFELVAFDGSLESVANVLVTINVAEA